MVNTLIFPGDISSVLILGLQVVKNAKFWRYCSTTFVFEQLSFGNGLRYRRNLTGSEVCMRHLVSDYILAFGEVRCSQPQVKGQGHRVM